MRGIFVAGTDTGAGKTLVSGLLARYLREKGHSAITQKWIQTGSRGFPPDIASHLRLMGMKKEDIKDYIPHVSCYNFKFPSSPHLAAALERKKIDVRKIRKSFLFLAQRFDCVIVEGVGGALVPINKKKTVIDIAGELGLPVLLVAENRLGAINHALLSLEALRKRKIKVIGVIFNNRSKKTARLILKDNPRIIREFANVTILGTLPRSEDKGRLYKNFTPIGKKILEETPPWISG